MRFHSARTSPSRRSPLRPQLRYENRSVVPSVMTARYRGYIQGVQTCLWAADIDRLLGSLGYPKPDCRRCARSNKRGGAEALPKSAIAHLLWRQLRHGDRLAPIGRPSRRGSALGRILEVPEGRRRLGKNAIGPELVFDRRLACGGRECRADLRTRLASAEGLA